MSATDGGVCDGSFKLLQNDNIQFSSTDLDSISQCTKHTMFTDQQVQYLWRVIEGSTYICTRAAGTRCGVDKNTSICSNTRQLHKLSLSRESLGNVAILAYSDTSIAPFVMSRRVVVAAVSL